MEVFVVVALAIAVFAAGTVVVAVVLLRRSMKRLREAIAAVSERLSPLASELRDETAVTSLELDGIQRRRTERAAHLRRLPPGAASMTRAPHPDAVRPGTSADG